jgi:peptidoglycan/xylan/chitin deacetylase (PgdA/CDA1 family)
VRLDRLITLGLVAPFRRPAGASARDAAGSAPGGPAAALDHLPVLMYHRIADDPEPGVSPYYRVCTSPRRFAEHMQWLADWGYKGVTLSQGLEALAGRMDSETSHPKSSRPDLQPHSPSPFSLHPSPPTSQKLVAITFDDGFRDFHTAAFPTLERHAFSATMYLPSAFIGESRLSFKSHECLSWAEVRELHRAGIEFGSHTVNHPTLVQLGWPDIQRELRDSKQAIEQHLGHAISSFAYPYAFPTADPPFTARLQGLLREAGYATCVTTEIGTVARGDDPLQLRRLPANECDDHRLLRAKLAGAYDWLHGVQALVKKIKPRPARPSA